MRARDREHLQDGPCPPSISIPRTEHKAGHTVGDRSQARTSTTGQANTVAASEIKQRKTDTEVSSATVFLTRTRQQSEAVIHTCGVSESSHASYTAAPCWILSPTAHRFRDFGQKTPRGEPGETLKAPTQGPDRAWLRPTLSIREETRLRGVRPPSLQERRVSNQPFHKIQCGLLTKIPLLHRGSSQIIFLQKNIIYTLSIFTFQTIQN